MTSISNVFAAGKCTTQNECNG